MPTGTRYTPEQILGKLREAELQIAKGLTASQTAKNIGVIERRQRDVVEKILRGHQRGAIVGGLWEGPLRTLATAQSPPESGDLARESAEPSELQLVLNPKYL